jgi:outer membrane lipoprotein carrier protein
MKKSAVLPLVVLSFLSFAFTPAGNVPPNKEKDKVANKLLKDVSKKYKAYKSIKADFTMVNETAQGVVEKAKTGSLISKGNSFKLTFLGQEIFCNGKFIWTYTKETNEVVKDNYNPHSSNGLNPAKIFTVWEKGFLYASDGTYKKDGRDVAKVKLTPTDKTKPYFLMNLEVDQAAKTLMSMKVSFKAGNKQTYTVTSQTPNSTIDDKIFEFNAASYPGVEVIDLTKKKK